MLLASVCSLSVQAEESIQWVNPPSKKAVADTPGLRHETFDSDAMQTKVGYSVVPPPSYKAETDRRYPVIYWLHGGGGNEASTLFTAQAWLKLYGENAINEVILVYPGVKHSLKKMFAAESERTARFQDEVFRELAGE